MAIPTRNWARVLTGELGLIVGSVILFAVFMLGLLRWYFPEGTGIEATDVARAGIDTDGGTAIGFASADGSHLRVGALTVRRNSVQSRSARDIDWRDAERGAVFYDRDAIQTGAGGYAAVRTADGTEVKVGERSLVVFDGSVPRFAADYARPVALVMRGEMSGQLAAGSGLSADVVRVNGGALSLSADADRAAEYTVRVNENDSATISVFYGQAEYAVDGGVTVIGQRKSLTVDEQGRQVALVDLPAAPRLVAPADRTRLEGRGGLTVVDFAWRPLPGVEGYRFVIARDAELIDRVTDERVTATRFRHGGLPVGNYYWSVQGRIGWTLGDHAGPRRLSIGKDDLPPQLVVSELPGTVSGRSVTVSGLTDPGARVYVTGEPAENRQGRFSHVTQLAAGANVIVVESVDPVGNVAYESAMVVAK